MVAFAASLSARELKSADGSKVINADFVRYMATRDMVTLKNNGRTMVLPADKFSEEDRKFFVEAQQEIDKKEALKVKVNANNDLSKESSGDIVTSYRTSHYTFDVTNTSESYLEGLVLRYWLAVEQGKKGEEEITIKSDSKELMPLAAGATEVVEGPVLKLALGAKSTSCASCPKVRRSLAFNAAQIERERVLGTKVEVVDAKGEVVYSEISTNRMKSLLAKESGQKNE
jgi:hypothetical protein